MPPLQKYAEYLSSDEISNYIDPASGELVEYRILRNVISKRRQLGNSWDKVST